MHRIKFEKTPQGVKKIAILDELDEEQKLLSKKLKAAFPSYVNQLQLQDETGNKLTSDENGEGSFKDYVMNFVLKSATKEKKTLDSQTRLQKLAVPGSAIESQEYITFQGEEAVAIDMDSFVAKITRMKRVPAFDSLTLECCENEEFGDENVFARHFTEFSMKHSKLKAEMADEEKIKLLNPIPFIENGNCDVAKNWRIRMAPLIAIRLLQSQ